GGVGGGGGGELGGGGGAGAAQGVGKRRRRIGGDAVRLVHQRCAPAAGDPQQQRGERQVAREDQVLPRATQCAAERERHVAYALHDRSPADPPPPPPPPLAPR